MGCSSCSSGGCSPAGCKSNGSCLTDGGCSRLDVYDWLSDMDMPANYKPFNIVEVRFKGSRKDFYINTNNVYLEAGELVVVEGNQGGYDIGHITLTGELVRMQMKKKGVKDDAELKKILRKATPADVEKWTASKLLENETMHKARKLALELNLSMKLSDVDYQGDRSKATFYYTADDRVDFRELIKRMAESFKIRIEMRQIGMRQEASRLGGIGSCGRELCCSTWLTDFKTVSTAAARYQNLSLNTLKLAGQCGKLKCCLNYELDSYIDALKDIPENVDRLETEKGYAKLQKTDIFKKVMWFSFIGQENWIPLDVNKVKEIVQMNKMGKKPADLKEMELVVSAPKVAVHDYENVVGQDSLTRLDERNKKKKKKRSKGKGGKDVKTAEGQVENPVVVKPQNTPRPQQSTPRPLQSTTPKPQQNTAKQPGQASANSSESAVNNRSRRPQNRNRSRNNNNSKPNSNNKTE
ncbi:PSP1 domain-containing protein [Solitalea koreensis]|uniref:Cell fate regulator YaaT, PSP1 superfamily (Controls sporulation, competence, biofilm development) n=1 Tax=Solitalea koreensis TaxID=543615 RepID=A0A521CNW5_9SPHI|nr:regulatory iron-sulfur-containing complex subunit RicT [Solitalea koreensis]SMO60441.1 Cell fate regulator YaaT, PSP1 superfamily (controls sporulation, competence, biofilm development) [Solitalea koreensis]